ncbi:junctional sarcoplasmic reticulum protein 1 isoform X2 [Brienomyrus brachyistius]|nr:junctional sarcoplasmic reticulum protein 1 isoform X2 [Brienomyrus brachyistius]XP_048844947.1 junctional sarcoplasmic reticulum protein 1 isoform X2 [Brienomyrus brachyistius]
MDESTFEMFEEELRSPAQQESAQKPIRHVRRADTQSLKRTMENLPSPQPTPKVTQQGMSPGLSLRRALSLPSLSQIESPWKNVTLNRCLILAITIVLIGSSFQRLYEVLQEWRHKDGPELSDPHTLHLRHVSPKQEVSLQQAESSLWDNWFWDWILDDEDEDDEENLKLRSKMKGDQRRGGRGSVGQLKHKKATDRKVVRVQEGKASDKKERRKKDKHEKEESFREVAKGHKDREKVRGRGFEDKTEETTKGKRRKAEGHKQERRQQETAELKKAGIRTHRHSM